jgi:predicted GTPase
MIATRSSQEERTMSEKTYTDETHNEELSDAVLDTITGGDAGIMTVVNAIGDTVVRVNQIALTLR